MIQQIKVLVAFCLFGFGTIIQAQNSISASGGNISGNGGSLNYTVGQVLYETIKTSNGSVSPGVQQPFDISVVSGIEVTKRISLEFSIYPNPATNFLKLKLHDHEGRNLRYQVYDMRGNILLENIIDGNDTNISLQGFISAIYFLKVIQGKRELKTFKIIKY